MSNEHDWSYGECMKCGFSTDLSGVSIEDAPPCTGDIEAQADEIDRLTRAEAESIVRIGRLRDDVEERRQWLFAVGESLGEHLTPCNVAAVVATLTSERDEARRLFLWKCCIRPGDKPCGTCGGCEAGLAALEGES